MTGVLADQENTKVTKTPENKQENKQSAGKRKTGPGKQKFLPVYANDGT